MVFHRLNLCKMFVPNNSALSSDVKSVLRLRYAGPPHRRVNLAHLSSHWVGRTRDGGPEAGRLEGHPAPCSRLISPCGIPGIGLLYAPRTGREFEWSTLLPGRTPRDAKIDAASNRVAGRRDTCSSSPGRQPIRSNPAPASGRVAVARLPGRSRGQGPVSRSETAGSQQPSATTAGSMADSREADPVAARAETLERLKEHDLTTGTDATTPIGSAITNSASTSVPAASHSSGRAAAPLFSPSDPAVKKPLPALLQDRLRWLNEYEATSLALQKATHPEPSPQQQASEAKLELGKLQSILKQAVEAPETLLPPLFRDRSIKASSALGAEMKDAIEVSGNELKDWKNKLETLRGEIARWNSRMNARRADRDGLFQRVTSLAAKNEEYKSAVTDAQTAALRRLAHERLINFEWQLRVESLRLRVIEAQLALEAKLSEVRELRADVYRAHVQIATKALEPMQARYRVVAEDQERDLVRAKADRRKQGQVI